MANELSPEIERFLDNYHRGTGLRWAYEIGNQYYDIRVGDGVIYPIWDTCCEVSSITGDSADIHDGNGYSATVPLGDLLLSNLAIPFCRLAEELDGEKPEFVYLDTEQFGAGIFAKIDESLIPVCRTRKRWEIEGFDND